MTVIDMIAQRYGVLLDKAIQTSDDQEEVLVHKLRMIDEQYGEQNNSQRISSHAALQQKMLDFQRDCDARAQADLEVQVLDSYINANDNVLLDDFISGRRIVENETGGTQVV